MTTEHAPSAPRPGVLGTWDRLVGPDATRLERGLVLGYGIAFTLGVLAYVQYAGLEWTPLQQAVVAAFALDVAGGIVANTTDAGRRWWHRPSQTRQAHFKFVAVHVHPFVLAALFAAVSWTDAFVVYGFLLASALGILAVPERLQRPVATTVFSIGLVLALVLEFPAGLEWFVPFLYLKLIGGHLAGAR